MAAALPLPVTHVSPGCSQSPRRGSPHAWGMGDLSQTCRKLVHPHMRGVDTPEPNGAVLPWQPGTAVFPNFGDTALRPPRPKSSAPPP